MWTTQFLGVLAVASAAVLASPVAVNATDVELEARAVKGYVCGTQKYTLTAVDNAMGDGIRLQKSLSFIQQVPGQKGTTLWPHEYRNGKPTKLELDPAPCAKLNLYEFPILPSGADYLGGAPGADRVVFADSVKTPGAYEQCFLMTHTGATGNLFVKCKTT